MARPRKQQNLKNQPITISLPPAMIAEVDEELSFRGSRSAWIATAIENRLSGTITPTEIPNRVLIDQLITRLTESESSRSNINPVTIIQLRDFIDLYFTLNLGED